MKANYTITSAKEQLVRCGLKTQGKEILGDQPGIRGWGAIDFLKKKGYSFLPDIPKVIKEKVLASMRIKL